jgi:hypothetical protein
LSQFHNSLWFVTSLYPAQELSPVLVLFELFYAQEHTTPFCFLFSWNSMQCELWLLSLSFSSKRKKALSIQKSYLELERSSIRDFGKL